MGMRQTLRTLGRRSALLVVVSGLAGCGVGSDGPPATPRPSIPEFAPGSKAMVYAPHGEDAVDVLSDKRWFDRVSVGAIVTVIDAPTPEGKVRIRARASDTRDPLGQGVPPEGIVGFIPTANLRPAPGGTTEPE